MSENTPEDSPLSSSNKLENSPVTYGINVDQHKKATEEDTGQPAPLNDVSATDKHSVETKPDVELVIAEIIAPVTHDNNVDNQPLQTIEVVGQAASVICANVDEKLHLDTKHDDGKTSPVTYDSDVDIKNNDTEENTRQPASVICANVDEKLHVDTKHDDGKTSPVTYDSDVDIQNNDTEENTRQPASVICANVDEKLHLDTKHDDGKTSPVTYDSDVDIQNNDTEENTRQPIAEPNAPVTNHKADNRTQETIEVLEQAVPETSDRNVDKTDHDKTEDAVQMQTSDIETLTKNNEILTAEIERLQQMFHESEENLKTFKQMFHESESHLTRSREKESQLEVRNNHLAEENTRCETTNLRMAEENNMNLEKITSLSAQLQKLGSKVTCIPVLEKEIEDHKQQYKQAQEKHDEAQEETFKQWSNYVAKLLKDQEAEVKNLQKELGDNKKKVTNLTEEKTKLKATLDKKDEENKKHIASAKNALKQLEDARREFEARKSNFEKQIKTLHGEKNISEKLASERHNIIEQKEREIWQYQQHIQQLQTDLNNHIITIKSLEKDKKDLTLRLSKLAGANLTYNNPNIADLSDENRPTKLAEEFSELYDNEWTDAFEVVKMENEREKTQFMLDILKRVSHLCHDTSRNHMEAIKKSLTTLVIQDLWEEEEEPVEEVIRIEAALQGDETIAHKMDTQGEQALPSQNGERNIKSLPVTVAADRDKSVNPPTSKSHGISDFDAGERTVNSKSGDQTDSNALRADKNGEGNTFDDMNDDQSKHQKDHQERPDTSPEITDQSKTNAEVPAISGSQTSMESNAGDNTNQEKQENQVSCDFLTQNKEGEVTQSIEEEKTLSKDKEKPQSKGELKTESLKEEKTQSDEEAKPQRKKEDKSQSKEEEKSQSEAEEKSQNKEQKPESKMQSMKEENPQSKEEEKPQSKKEEKPHRKEEEQPQIKAEGNFQSPEEEKTQSKVEEKSQNKEEQKPESKTEEKTQSMKEENPQSKEEEKPQSKKEEKPHRKEEEHPQIKAEGNIQSLDEEKTRSKEEESIQSKIEDKLQNIEEGNTQSKVEEKPQSLKIENIQNKVEEKPQSMEGKKIQSMEIENTEQNRTNVKGGLTNGNQASHETNITNVDSNIDHTDGENCKHQTENKVVGASSTADKNIREDGQESSNPESDKADKDIRHNGDNCFEKEISKPPDDNQNKSKDFQKSESTKRCSRKTQTYFKTLSTNFDQLTNEQKKTILDIRKLFENQMSNDFHKTGQDILAKEIVKEKQPHEFIDIYIAKCMKICWSMCRHEPPVHIHFPEIKGDLPYDTNMYKPYTKTGKHLDFVVWPAMYLHENGPMLAKGVAQGRK